MAGVASVSPDDSLDVFPLAERIDIRRRVARSAFRADQVAVCVTSTILFRRTEDSEEAEEEEDPDNRDSRRIHQRPPRDCELRRHDGDICRARDNNNVYIM